jgi:dihydroorotate dehydrogenase (NAD+) catalytic subunit
MIDISTKICRVKFSSPTILASGILLNTTAASMLNIIKNGAGSVVTKSISLESRKGHPAPILLSLKNNTFINAVGLANAGIDKFENEIIKFKKQSRAPLIVSIFASTVEEFGQIAKKVSSLKPDLIEVNISCPNVEDEFGLPFGTDADLAAEVTSEVKKNSSQPIIIKLTPNVSSIVKIAKAVEKAGADAIAAINTLGPGMVIDIATKKPVLGNKMGGISGSLIKPIAVRCVYQIYQAVKIPIIGVGGIFTGADVIEMMMAGASAVEIGSAFYTRGPRVFKKISQEIRNWLQKNHYERLKDIIGLAHTS